MKENISKKIRVCILINNLGSGGAERQAINIAKMLSDNMCDVSIVTYRTGTFLADGLKEHNITYKILHSSNPILSVWKTRREFINGKYDVVIAFLRSPMLCACAASVTKKWKLILRLGSAREGFFTSKIGKILTHLAKHSDAIVCNSENERRMWLAHSGIAPDKIHVIYNIHGKLNINASTEEVSAAQKVRLVIPASYSSVKNVDSVLKAVAMLEEADRNKLEVHWYGHKEIALGDTSVFDNAVIEVEKNGLQKIVFLHDETKEIHSVMQEGDFVGLFSHFEGLPNAICEGLLLSKPIIMTRVSDYSILVNGNGFLCDPTPDSIREALHKAVSTTAEERREMGIVSKQIAQKYLAYERIEEAWMELLPHA